MEHHGLFFHLQIDCSLVSFPSNHNDDKSQTVITNELNCEHYYFYNHTYYIKLIGFQLDERSKIILDARSAIATRIEFGVPEIGDGTTLASIILNPLTPFTLEIYHFIIIIPLYKASYKYP